MARPGMPVKGYPAVRWILVLLCVLLVAGQALAKSDVDAPAVTKPALYAIAGAEVPVCAVVAGEPYMVLLSWSGSGDSGQSEMQQVSDGIWSGAIPGSAVTGVSVDYIVTAYYGDGKQTSKGYELLVCAAIPSCDARPVKVAKKVLVSRPWGIGDDCFGVDGGPVGAVTVPSAIAFSKGKIQLLDTANSRVLTFSQCGKQLGKIDLPSNTASDIAVDAATGALAVVDQAKGKIYKVSGGGAVAQTASNTREALLNSKFTYDSTSGKVKTSPIAVEVKETSLLLGLGKGRVVEINLGVPVLDAAEVVTDGKGAVWILVGALEGDGAAKYLVCFDKAKDVAGIAKIDVTVPGDLTRSMAGADTGVVLFEGDREAGRIVSFQLAGGEF